MGKGDKKSKRGKIILGTYGVRRSKKGKKTEIIAAAKAKAPVIEEKVKPEKAVVKTTKPKAAPKSSAKTTVKTTEKAPKPVAKTTEKAPKPAAKTTKSASKKKE